MAEAKTKRTLRSVEDFLNSVADTKRRADAFAVLDIMRKITRLEPAMWGDSMVGFGMYHYRYESGHEGDCFMTGFSPRKQYLAMHIMTGFDRHLDLMKKLGKYKTGKSCLYIKDLADIDLPTLKKLIEAGYREMKQQYKKSRA
jgi:hypothetical protein